MLTRQNNIFVYYYRGTSVPRGSYSPSIVEGVAESRGSNMFFIPYTTTPPYGHPFLEKKGSFIVPALPCEQWNVNHVLSTLISLPSIKIFPISTLRSNNLIV